MQEVASLFGAMEASAVTDVTLEAELGAEQAAVVAAALPRCPAVRSLELGGNQQVAERVLLNQIKSN